MAQSNSGLVRFDVCRKCLLCCTLRYKKQGGLQAYWQTTSVHEIGVDMASVTVHNLRPDTTYRFRVMWRSQHDDEAHFSNVVIAHTAGRPTSSLLSGINRFIYSYRDL